MYEKLLREAEQQGVDIYEVPMPKNIRGLYGDNVIWVNKKIESQTEKACVLAEEIGHYHTSAGHILDQSCILNRKQEKRARSWAYEKLVPLSKIVQAYLAGVENCHQLAQYLEVTDSFLIDALKRYQEKYGLKAKHGPYIIYFNPLQVRKEDFCG